MAHPELLINTYPEELYLVPSQPVVALNTEWSSISESERILLEKILASVKLSLNHVKLITTRKLDILQWTNRPDRVIAFGIEVPGLSKYEVIEIHGIKLIVAAGLTDLEVDAEAKKKLWNALRQMF
jgi:DNA polymerase III psi subunit